MSETDESDRMDDPSELLIKEILDDERDEVDERDERLD